MRCAVHQDRDAIAFCQSCGNGLCSDCRISITGVAYCQVCLDVGRVRSLMPVVQEPFDRLPTPIGTVTSSIRRNFLFGIIGMIILAISIHFLWIYPMFSYGLFYVLPENMRNVPHTLGLGFVAVGFTICGFAFDEFKNYFNYRWGFYIGLFTILSPWVVVFGDLLLYTNLVYFSNPMYYWSFSPGPLFIAYFAIMNVGTILIGVLLILYPVALISVRKHIKSKSLTLTSSILFLIAAHVILFLIPLQSTYLVSIPIFLFGGIFTLYQAVLIEPAAILTAIIFNRLRKSLKPG